MLIFEVIHWFHKSLVLLILIRLHLLQTFDCLILLSLVGRIIGVLRTILANIYLNQEMQVILIL